MEWKLFRVKKDWRYVLRYAWSSWLIITAGALTGLEVLAPLLWDRGFLDLPPLVYPCTMMVLTGAALIARLLVQTGFNDG